MPLDSVGKPSLSGPDNQGHAVGEHSQARWHLRPQLSSVLSPSNHVLWWRGDQGLRSANMTSLFTACHRVYLLCCPAPLVLNDTRAGPSIASLPFPCPRVLPVILACDYDFNAEADLISRHPASCKMAGHGSPQWIDVGSEPFILEVFPERWKLPLHTTLHPPPPQWGPDCSLFHHPSLRQMASVVGKWSRHSSPRDPSCT